MEHPTIHLNGTSKEQLIEGWEKAYDKLSEARTLLTDTAPHGRDFYPQMLDNFAKAREEHFARMQRITDVMEELEQLMTKAQG